VSKPRIAVIMDENTSSGGTRYEAAKGYFSGLIDAGGIPFGIPYHKEAIDLILNEYDGVMATGGRFSYPAEWYVGDEGSSSPASDRFELERILVKACLERNKPLLGICAGMQKLACLNGCRLTRDLRATVPFAFDHDGSDKLHPVNIAPGSQLASIIGVSRIEVNSFHREAVVELGNLVTASARADDGVVKAIEIASQSFAIGLQWHQELLSGGRHRGNAIFRAFVEAAS